MRKSLPAVLCISLVVLISLSCQITYTKPTTEPSPTAAQTLPQTKPASPTPGGGNDPGPVETQPAVPFPGRVSFEVNPAHSATLALDAAASQDQVVILTTSTGVQWSLTIPPGAAPKNVNVRLTELKNITSPDLGRLQTGVLLEPDGLQFSQRVRLSLRGASSAQAQVYLFQGRHDGSGLNFAMSRKEAGGVSAYLSHFSTVYADPMADEKARKMMDEAASKGYASILKRALQVLNDNPPKIAEPPAMPLKCVDETGEQYQKELATLNAYNEKFREPEYSLISALLAIALRDGEWDEEDNQIGEVVKSLTQRTLQKVDLLWQAYYPREEFFMPVSMAAYNNEQDVSNLEFLIFERTQPRLVYFQKRHEWAAELAKKFLAALRDRHDYQYVAGLILVDRAATLDAEGTYQVLLPEITKALTFKIQFQLQASTDVEYDTVTWETQGIVKYNMLTTPNRAAGQGRYTGFNWPTPDDLPPVEMTNPKEFDYEVIVNVFDVCKTNTIEISFNKFARDLETYEIEGTELPFASRNGFVSAITLATFEKETVPAPAGRGSSPWFKFRLPAENLNVVAGEIEIPRSVPNNTATLKITVTHAPEK